MHVCSRPTPSLRIAATALVALCALACGPGDGARPRTTDDASPGDGGAVAADAVIVIAADASHADASATDAPPLAVDAAPDDGVTGRACTAGEPPCPDGYNCYTTGCIRAVAVGQPCERLGSPCIFGSSCLEALDGSGYRCLAYGTAGANCRYAVSAFPCRHAPSCDEGLGCDGEPAYGSARCRPALGAGALCGGRGDLCSDHAACVDVDGTSRCVADGSAGGICRADGDPSGACGAGLACVLSLPVCERGRDRCGWRVAAGADCAALGAFCAPDATCVAGPDGAKRCVANGAPGADCRATEPACDAGAECVGGGCVRRLERWASCDPSGRTTRCADGDTCSAEHVADAGQCVPPGVAPGADCRATEPACDGALRCSDFTRYRRTCRLVAAVGDRCDLSGVQTLCPANTRCVPGTDATSGARTARCTAPVAEVEPNERAVGTLSVSDESALYSAALRSGDAEDCFAARVPDGASLYVEVASPVFFTNEFVLGLFGPAGAEVGRWTLRNTGGGGPLGGSARIEPESARVLRGLAAGQYVVCLRATAPIDQYALAIGVLPPPLR